MIILTVLCLLIILISKHKGRAYSANWIFETPPEKWKFWVEHEKTKNPNFNWENWEKLNSEKLNQ